MPVARIKDLPYPEKKFESHEDAWEYCKELRNRLQEEQSERIEDFDILKLDNVPWIDVREYGAKGDDSTDNATALNAAATEARSKGAKLFAPEGNYRVNAAIDFTDIKIIDFRGVIKANFHGIVVHVGKDFGVDDFVGQADIYINQIYNITGSVDSGDIGLYAVNLKYGKLRWLNIGSFEYGVICSGNLNGFGYNEVFAGAIDPCKFGLTLECVGATGWANVNKFYHLGHIKSIAGNLGYNIWIKSSQLEDPNGNVFYSPVLNLASFGIQLAACQDNIFHDVYCESSALARFDAGAINNKIYHIFGQADVTDNSGVESNRVFFLKKIYESKARAYLGSDQEDVADNTPVTVELDTENYDPGSKFTTASHAYVAPMNGYYQINAQVTWAAVVADKQYLAILDVGGASKVINTIHSSNLAGQSIGVPISDVLYLAKDDVVLLKAKHVSGAATPDIKSGTAYTYMSIHFLTP